VKVPCWGVERSCNLARCSCLEAIGPEFVEEAIAHTLRSQESYFAVSKVEAPPTLLSELVQMAAEASSAEAQDRRKRESHAEIIALTSAKKLENDTVASRIDGQLAALREAVKDDLRQLLKHPEQVLRAGETAPEKITALESRLADVLYDLAEREHQVDELQQALQYERELRQRRERERDQARELLQYLMNSRWRKLGQAIGAVKKREWERELPPV
jgi:chromosome segregation ATPase